MNRPVCEFEEHVLYMPLKADRGGKFDARFLSGVYLGALTRTGEAIIGTETGAVRVRAIRRLPDDKRWDKDDIGKIVGTPWAPATMRNVQSECRCAILTDVHQSYGLRSSPLRWQQRGCT